MLAWQVERWTGVKQVLEFREGILILIATSLIILRLLSKIPIKEFEIMGLIIAALTVIYFLRKRLLKYIKQDAVVKA